MKNHARDEYVRRGEPAKTTRWDVDTISTYMEWKLANSETGEDIGAYAHKFLGLSRSIKGY